MRDKVAGVWNKQHNEEPHNLYFSRIIRTKSRRMKWAEHAARMWEKRNGYSILVGTTEGKRPLGVPGCGWEDNIKMDLCGSG
jgi:hypothetical protein